MQEPNPISSSPDVLHHIRRLSQEAEWRSEELDEALREGGVDPVGLVSRVTSDIQRLLRDEGEATGRTDSAMPARPLLVALRASTQLTPSAIAAALEVPVPFLSMVSRHPKAVPVRWQQELARRAEQHLEMDPQAVIQSFSADFQYDRATSRDAPYTADTVQHYEDILKRSGMSPDAQTFWQSLASDA